MRKSFFFVFVTLILLAPNVIAANPDGPRTILSEDKFVGVSQDLETGMTAIEFLSKTEIRSRLAELKYADMIPSAEETHSVGRRRSFQQGQIPCQVGDFEGRLYSNMVKVCAASVPQVICGRPVYTVAAGQCPYDSCSAVFFSDAKSDFWVDEKQIQFASFLMCEP